MVLSYVADEVAEKAARKERQARLREKRQQNHPLKFEADQKEIRDRKRQEVMRIMRARWRLSEVNVHRFAVSLADQGYGVDGVMKKCFPHVTAAEARTLVLGEE
jgi:glycine cleavage system protein P-like pyridoxal-binding family